MERRHVLQEQEFGHVDMAYSGRGPQRLRQALSRTSVTPHQLASLLRPGSHADRQSIALEDSVHRHLRIAAKGVMGSICEGFCVSGCLPLLQMVTGGLLLAAFLGGNMLRWTLKRRRRKGHGVAATVCTSQSATPVVIMIEKYLLQDYGWPTCTTCLERRLCRAPLKPLMCSQEMEEEGDAGRDTGDLEGRAISNDAAPAQESGKAFSEAQEAYIAHQASGRSPGMSFAVETGGMQRHASAVIPKRPLPRRLLARGASPEELNGSLYQYAALALDQAGGSRATRR